MYQKITKLLLNLVPPHLLFKYGFNWSPMYRRSTGKVDKITKDLHRVEVRIPLTWRNRNYVGSMFGGSLYSATDPIYMIQLIHILGEEYVVWDKSSTIQYKRPVFSGIRVVFEFTPEEIADIKARVATEQAITIVKPLELIDQKGTICTTLEKTLYISSKQHYKNKRRQAKAKAKEATS